ncbi:DMT family transporter [Marinobacterium sedimentorum]|uniref:DMT family transporter n=1 Tax=Marinobacterium sedimentorum TaxID=2927804 RepID=UPI0020C687E4|nr:DMT family transporter [Marinobacterium sedimentorum]
MDQYRGEPAVTACGLVAIAVTLLIWTGFLLSLRTGSQSALTPTDLALMRFGLPALLFAPLLIRRWPQIRPIRPHYALMLILGGLPFFYLIALGCSYAPAAHAGALVPGTAPLFVTALAVLLFREPLPRQRLLGLGVIVAGIAVLLGGSLLYLANGYWRGHLAFLGASLLWAFYTLGLRVIGIGALEATALLSAGSLLGLMVLLTGGWVDSNLTAIAWSGLWPYLLTQGLGAGIIGGFTYGVAIRELGAEKTAALGSFTPALAALAATLLLDERLSASALVGVLTITLGVLLASHVRRRQASIEPRLEQH